MANKKIAKKKKSKKSSSKGPDLLKLAKYVWPLERDILYRPDRLKYVRKLVKAEECVFCCATKNISFDSLSLYQTKHSLIVLNKYPYNSGHIMVIPRRHCGDLLKLTQEEHYDLHDTLRLAMKALNDVYQPGGINIGLNHGATAGAGIPDHIHYHVIPRWNGDLNFFPLVAETKVVVESLEQTYERLLGYFKTRTKA
ncbi:MAG: HIT domain-containing protein [Bdellovibrionaceae bacterium]|nr:HIT domain-containing protein [Pseudobdellovibrionaceae bacterium]